jgi:gamma-glutamylaminecyclotransferase
VSELPTCERRFVLFVYGTLLSGEPSHELLGDGARALGPAKTPPEFYLVDLGPYPALVMGGPTSIVGELYEVSAPTLAAIDVHEQVPILFKRMQIALDDGTLAEAYMLDADQVRGRRRLRSGDWRGRFRATPAPSARDAPFVRSAKNRVR